jgi:hypothetical protein
MHYPTVREAGPPVRTLQGNRVVLEHALGRPLRPGYFALHHCDRKNCLRAHHLYEGTRTDNALDRVHRQGHHWSGRDMSGERAYAAKLTERDVWLIRALADEGVTQRALAARFNISNQQISRIVTGKRWTYLPMGGITPPGVVVEAK